VASFNVEEVLRDRLGNLGIPVVSEPPFGHDGCNAALPLGVEVTLDTDSGISKITK
jgi:muramoyltetrapeptide carboxypeptidase